MQKAPAKLTGLRGHLWGCMLLGIGATSGWAVAAAAEVQLSNTQALSFGRFVAGAGSVTISPSGARSTTGGVLALGSDPGQAAQFLITGDPNATVSIGLPSNGTVSLSNGSQSMPVNNFTSSPASTAVLAGGGSQVLNVGATLQVSAGQGAGAYSGSFSITIDYN